MDKDLSNVTIDTVRDLKRRGLFDEAKELVLAFQSVGKSNIKEGKRINKGITVNIKNFKRRKPRKNCKCVICEEIITMRGKSAKYCVNCAKENMKKYHEEYGQRPEVKERQKECRNRPEVKERQKEYEKKYRLRPEIIKHRKEYNRERYVRKKGVINDQ